MRHVLFVSLLAFAATAACSGSPAPVVPPTPPVAPTPAPTAPTAAAPNATSTPAAAASKPVATELLSQSLRFTQSLPAMHLKATAQMVLPELPEEIAAQLEGQELPSFEVAVPEGAVELTRP